MSVVTPIQCPVAERFHLPYIAYFEDGEKRAARGQEQTKCGACDRYAWPDRAKACPLFFVAAPAEDEAACR